MKRKIITFLTLLICLASCDKHTYIDLGLPSGTLWATCNIGAHSPSDYGDYYAWGENKVKSKYTWSTYKFVNTKAEVSYGFLVKYHLTKYCNDSIYGDSGFIDKKTQLEPSDDVSYIKWGEDWSIPTKAQWEELLDNCIWKAVNKNGKNCYQVMGPNHNTIYLPASGFCDTLPKYKEGYGRYWANSIELGRVNRSYYAWALDFNEISRGMVISDRYKGYAIRPVKNKK